MFFNQILCATDEDGLRNILGEDDNIDIISATGFTRPLAYAEIGWKGDIIRCLKLHYCLANVHSCLQQMREGLQTLGVLNKIQEFPRIMERFFIFDENAAITAGDVTIIF